jgi:hypothetical protein
MAFRQFHLALYWPLLFRDFFISGRNIFADNYSRSGSPPPKE